MNKHSVIYPVSEYDSIQCMLEENSVNYEIMTPDIGERVVIRVFDDDGRDMGCYIFDDELFHSLD